jgi:MFS family permease
VSDPCPSMPFKRAAGARVPVLLGAIFFFGGVFATSFCKVYWQFILAQGVCTCFGLGMWLVPAVTAPAHYFKKRRPIALGLVVSGSSIGGVVWPIALNQLLMHRRLSFGWSVRIVGFAQLGVLMLGAACIKTRFRHTMKQRPPLGAALADPRFFATSLANLVLNFGLYMPFLFIGDYSVGRRQANGGDCSRRASRSIEASISEWRFTWQRS